MPYYQVLCLASGRLSRRELSDLVFKTARAFMSQGAVVTRLHALGANGHGPRQLAYNIRRGQVNYPTGYYLNICAFASPAALKEVSRRLSLDESVLRFLATRAHPSEAAAPPPNIDRSLPAADADPSDPAFELRKFLNEYERDFPDGQTVEAAPRPDEDHSHNTSSSHQRSQDDAAVEAVLRNMQASAASTQPISSWKVSQSANPASAGTDSGLRWLLDYSDDESRKDKTK
jgi:ribosomal protein S6